MFTDQPIDDLLHIGQRELAIGRIREAAAPGVEDLHRLRTGQDLTIEVAGHRLRQLVQQGMHGLGVVVEHGLALAEVLRRAALDHVGGQRPGATGEADQWRATIELAADGAHGIHHVAKILLGIGNRQRLDVGQAADLLAEARPFAGLEVQPLAHGIGDGEDVGKENRRVDLRIAIQRLQGNLARQLRILHQTHEIAGLGTGGAVFRQVTPGLPHHPHRGDVDRLLEQGTKETVVLQGSHVWVPAKKCRTLSQSP